MHQNYFEVEVEYLFSVCEEQFFGKRNNFNFFLFQKNPKMSSPVSLLS